jgi:hypothetical protein
MSGNWPMVEVVGLKALKGFRLWLQFSEGSEGVRNLSDVLELEGPMIAPLRRPTFFLQVVVENGAPTWPNGFDLDPINLYMELSDEGLLVRISWHKKMTEPVNDVLISEVAGPGRWGQFNAPFDIVRDYFRTTPRAKYDLRLQHVNSAGNAQREERPAVIYKANSRNWAFEIGAAQSLKFPGKTKRPIAVFVRQPGKGNDFLYRLLLPGDSGYDQVAKYLAVYGRRPANQLRREILTIAELKSLWPESPLLKNRY